MTDWREKLIKQMAKAIEKNQVYNAENWETEARAALAVAEPVIREQADNALREENARLRGEADDLRATLRNCLTDANFMRAAAAAIREGENG